jgi:hypothetical protein
LERNFATARDYALSEADLCPETFGPRNRLVNFRAFGASGLACARYPRERLFRALALLLWETGERDKVRSALRTGATDFAGLVSAYERLWRQFN